MLEERPAQRSQWHVSTRWFDEAKDDIRKTWATQPVHAPLVSKLRVVNKTYKVFCKHKADIH